METINIIRHDPSELKEDEHSLLICLCGAFGKKWVCSATYNHERKTFNNGAMGSYETDQVLWFIKKDELTEAIPISLDVKIASKSIRQTIDRIYQEYEGGDVPKINPKS